MDFKKTQRDSGSCAISLFWFEVCKIEKNEIELYAYQKTDANWLCENKKFKLLAHEMGLGKSAIAIIAADQIKADRIFIFCPAIARVNWLREFHKFSLSSRNFEVIQSRDIPIATRGKRDNSFICSYDLSLDFDPLSFGEFDLLILDECHYLKNLEAKRTQKILGKNGYARQAKRIWALSGTPAPNNVSEMWAILYTFGYVKERYAEFIKEYCDTRETSYGTQILGTKAIRIPQFKEKVLSKCMLRRTAQQVLKDLPAITYSDFTVPAGIIDLNLEASFIQYIFPSDRSNELKELLDSERKLFEDIQKKEGFTVQGMRLLEGLANSISTLRRYTGIQKVEAVANLVKEELENNAYEKIIIFAIHRDVIEGLRRRLSMFKPVTLYGGTPPDQKQKNIDKFMQNKKCRIFIGNIQACGTAINLTASNQVLFIEQDWVPGNNMQAAKRAHRIGQEKPVFVRFAGLENSFDEKMSHILRRKTKELTEIFDKNLIESFSALT